MSENKIPLDKKLYLTVTEASEYSGIGINTIQGLLKKEGCPFLLCVGRKRMVRRTDFEEFLSKQTQI